MLLSKNFLTFKFVMWSKSDAIEPFTDLTFPKENILPEEKKNSWIHGKKFEYERLSISACEHARVL